MKKRNSQKNNIADEDVFSMLNGESNEDPSNVVREVWLNKKQLQFKRAIQPVKCFVGGRGGGKTRIESDHCNDCADEMPGSRGLIYGQDYTQLRTKEIVEIIDVWKFYGMTEWSRDNEMGDFVIGIHPPAGWLIKHEYQDWSNVISFPDGTVMEMISGKSGGNVKGGSYDWGIIVEAKDCDKNHFFKNVFPMVRGRKGKFKSRFYLSWGIFSNMPYDPERYWVPDMVERAKDYPDRYFYMECTIWDNVDLYGKEYILQQKELICEVSPLVWDVEYENNKKIIVENPFYGNLRPALLYDEINNIDPYYDPITKPISLSFDFNQDIYCMSCYQTDGNSKRFCINFFHTLTDSHYLDNVNAFHKYYNARQFERILIIHGDVNGWHVKDEDGRYPYDVIRERLEELGWTVIFKVHTHQANPGHFDKHQVLWKVFGSDYNGLTLYFNRQKAMDVYISCANTRMGKHYTKDKTSEKKLKGKNRVKATDPSDTVDYYVMNEYNELTGQNTTGGGMSVDIM